MNKVLFLVLAVLLSQPFILVAQTPKEIYDYEYIVALYEQQADSTALIEISSFILNYPNSEFAPLVKFMEGEIYYFAGEFSRASIIYESLTDRISEISTLSDLYLHHAICLFYLNSFGASREKLEALLALTIDAEYNSQAYIWLAKAAFGDGQFYSSEKYYLQAIKSNPDDLTLKYEHFRSLLELEREDEAIALFRSLGADAPDRDKYLESLLAYYLKQSQYKSFNDLINTTEVSFKDTSDNIRLLLLQYAVTHDDYLKVQDYLINITTFTPQLYYYKALVLKNNGDYPAADSILAKLSSGSDPDLAVQSYLERLKILFITDAESAMTQLLNYIDSPLSGRYKGEQYLLAGYFAFQLKDYTKSISLLNSSLEYPLNNEQLERVMSLNPRNWLNLASHDRAIEGYNRYLNLYPQGRYRNKAWYDLGLLLFNQKDYPSSSFYFQNLLTEQSDHSYSSQAEFYLGEISFFKADYPEAIRHYTGSLMGDSNNSLIHLRIAQSHYFNQDYVRALTSLSLVADSDLTSDKLLLLGSIHFNQNQYQSALETYEQALAITAIQTQRTELLSYKALTLYQLKEFSEASALFLELSQLDESPDTYLFLSAKSASQGGNYAQALLLYDRFLEVYPESNYILDVNSEIALISYNQGNYRDALASWISILRRFKATSGFEQTELQLLRNVFAGMELCLLQIDSLEEAETIMSMVDSFNSDYIKFELQYLLVKLYASQDQWESLLSEAESIRSSLPSHYSSDIEILVAESLIKLNRFSEADSLLNVSYAATQSPDLLLKWAELDDLNGDYASSLSKYRSVYLTNPNRDVWFRMLQASSNLEFADFVDIWDLNPGFSEDLPEAKLLYIRYLIHTSEYQQAYEIADTMLMQNYSPLIHSQCFLLQARTFFLQGNYAQALPILQRVRVVFRDYQEVIRETNYLLIKSLFLSGSEIEARSLFQEVMTELKTDMIQDISSMMGE